MITSISDLQNRTLTESNPLRSYILNSSNSTSEILSRSDILIHEYQMANSITLNTILTNFLYGIKDTSLLYEGTSSENSSYFTIINSMTESDIDSLDDQVRLFLYVNNGTGSFYSRKLKLASQQETNPDGTKDFVNLDAIWYGIVVTEIVSQKGTEQNYNEIEDAGESSTKYKTISYDRLILMDAINNQTKIEDTFFGGINPFDELPLVVVNPTTKAETQYTSFNDYMKKTSITSGVDNVLNVVIYNLFFNNSVFKKKTDDEIYGVIASCRYFICCTNGWFGLQTVKTNDDFTSLKMYDIGSMIRNIINDGAEYEFKDVNFKTIDEETTLFVTIKETTDTTSDFPKYHYLFVNEQSIDTVYGFQEIKALASDGIVVEPVAVFHGANSMKQLGDTAIAMTDYGFWDLEPNESNEIIYSYTQSKNYRTSTATSFVGRTDKVAPPNRLVSGKMCEYNKEWLPDNAANPTYYTYDNGVKYDTLVSTPTSGTSETVYKLKYPWTIVGNPDSFKDDGKTLKTDETVDAAPRFPATILKSRNPFYAATDTFAIYDYVSDDNPVYLLADITQDEFNNLLYSNSDLVNCFTKWLYDQVVHNKNNPTCADCAKTVHPDPEYGEYYLYSQYAEFLGKLNPQLASVYTNVEYALSEGNRKSILLDRFINTSMPMYSFANQFNAETSLADASTLSMYCTNLYNILNNTGWTLDWLFGANGESVLKNAIKSEFPTIFSTQYKTAFVNNIVNVLVNECPLLGYFKEFLVQRITNDLSFSNQEITLENVTSVITNIKNHILSQVKTAMVLGSYDSTQSGNACYDGFDNYAGRNYVQLAKNDVKYIMSASAEQAEITNSVNETTFITTCISFDKLIENINNENLFKLSSNEAYIGISGLLDSSNRVKVTWDTFKNWLNYDVSTTDETKKKHTANPILKAYIRTQFYRPMFFKYDNYSTFTSDETKYKCTTNKYYENENGVTNALNFQLEGTSWKTDDDGNPIVNPSTSGLTDSHIQNIQYLLDKNKLKYEIHSDSITVVDGKFVYDDVQYYVAYFPSDTTKVSSIYFNAFQSPMASDVNAIALDADGKFSLDGIQYQISDNYVLSLDGYTSFDEEYRQEIVDNRFIIDGIQYVFDETNKCVKYEKVIDEELTQIRIAYVDNIGYGKLGNEYKFQFTDSTHVNVVRYYTAVVIDRLASEWCEFDDETLVFDNVSGKTFDWNLVNKIIKMIKDPLTAADTKSLGNGNLYSGDMEVDCTVSLTNEIQNGRVASIITLSRTVSGSVSETEYETLYDDEMEQQSRMLKQGDIDSSTGLITESTSGSKIFILKDMTSGLTNLNSIWVDKTIWDTNVQIKDWETCTENENTGAISFTAADGNVISIVQKSESSTDDGSGVATNTRAMYVVSIGGYSSAYNKSVYADLNDNLSVLDSNGVRYLIDITADEGKKTVKQLKFGEMPGKVIDFTSTYSFDDLRNNLASNIQSAVKNIIIQNILDNGSNTIITATPEVSLDLYLDLFTDQQSLNSYQLVSEVESDSNEAKKFSEVFKNNLSDIDDSSISSGKIYLKMQDLINGVFTGGAESITLIDEPAIFATRQGDNDLFTYKVHFDIAISSSKKLVKQLKDDSLVDFEQHYIVGNPTIKNVECDVTVKPIFNSEESGELKYDVQFYVNPNTSVKTYSSDNTSPCAIVEYSVINYEYGNKVGSKTLSQKKTIEIPVNLENGLLNSNGLSSWDTNDCDDTFGKTWDYADATTGERLGVNKEFITTRIDMLSTVSRLINVQRVQHYFVNINNSIAETVEISNTQIKNGDNQTVWNLFESIPSAYSSKVIPELTSRGYARISGSIYRVSSDDKYLEPTFGGTKLAIYRMNAHPSSQDFDELEDYDSDGTTGSDADFTAWDATRVSVFPMFESTPTSTNGDTSGILTKAYLNNFQFLEFEHRKYLKDADNMRMPTWVSQNYTIPAASEVITETKQDGTTEEVTYTRPERKYYILDTGSTSELSLGSDNYTGEYQESPTALQVELEMPDGADSTQGVETKSFPGQTVEVTVNGQAYTATIQFNYIGSENQRITLTGFTKKGDTQSTFRVDNSNVTKINVHNEAGEWYKPESDYGPDNIGQSILYRVKSAETAAKEEEYLDKYGMSSCITLAGDVTMVYNNRTGTVQTTTTHTSDETTGITTITKTVRTITESEDSVASTDKTVVTILTIDYNLVTISKDVTTTTINTTSAGESTTETIVTPTEVTGGTDIPEGYEDCATEPTQEITTINYKAIVNFYLVFDGQVQSLFRKPDASKSDPYVAYNRYFAYNSGTSIVANVWEITDVNQDAIGTIKAPTSTSNPSGTNQYGMMFIPTNITSATTYSEIKLSTQFLYFEFNMTSGATTNAVQCKRWLKVLAPGESWSDDCDIYDRYFVVGETHTVSIFNQLTGIQVDEDASNVFLNKSTTKKSIKLTCDNSIWNPLILGGNKYIASNAIADKITIPYSMQEGIEKLVETNLKLTDETIEASLIQIKQFIIQINTELKDLLDSQGVIELATFKFTDNSAFTNYDSSKWWNESGQLFYHPETGTDIDTIYNQAKTLFNSYLYSQFFQDFQTLQLSTDFGASDYTDRDYHYIIISSYADSPELVDATRYDELENLYKCINYDQGSTTDEIYKVFNNYGDTDYTDDVRFINCVKTSIQEALKGVYVMDEMCHLFSGTGTDKSWYTFNANESIVKAHLDSKMAEDNYVMEPELQDMDYSIRSSDTDFFRFANRDFIPYASKNISYSDIIDTYTIRCIDDDGNDLWYLSALDSYLYSISTIVDIAYEQNYNSVYVIFDDDNYIYRFDDIEDSKDSTNRIVLDKNTADYKIETFHSMAITNNNLDKSNTNTLNWIIVDYLPKGDSDEIRWNISSWGKLGRYNTSQKRVVATVDQEDWIDSPGSRTTDFTQDNTIIFGDSLFDEGQLVFQNISKKKEMYDILDVNAVDNDYYGLYKDETNSTEDKTVYSVFKSPTTTVSEDDDSDYLGEDQTVIEKLPYRVVTPEMFKSADSLYSLWVVEEVVDESSSTGYKTQLREISVPNSDLYQCRVIPLQEIINQDEDDEQLDVYKLVMSEFQTLSSGSAFFSLSDAGFHKIYYKSNQDQLSIDSLTTFKARLSLALTENIFAQHLKNYHQDDEYFSTVAKKINQFSDTFKVFDLIPTEFSQTQVVGVIPSTPKVDDTDEVEDHRVDSIQASTDIFPTDGMIVNSDENPGIITGAVSNPATIYDDNDTFTKAQRNPSLEGTNFYDYIYDQDGNVLLDLYAIPFIYRVNSNNTYDLYINVPTTRTKYLNRIAGTLKDDGTSQVLADDNKTRLNFDDESMPNNLDESTTHLRIYIDRKFVSVGNVELVEICGNSIPTQIYRDETANDSLYDSIALESRWDGNLNEILEPAKDINKVMLEFECYGTDSQSIHITGKTLINPYLDDDTYDVSV